MVKPYSEKEINLLKEIFETNPKNFIISNFPGRSSQSIFRTAKKLGLKRSQALINQDIFKNGMPQRDDSWSEEELRTLTEIYQSNLQEFIESKLPRRNWKAIRAKALKLDIHRDPKLCRQDREIDLIEKGEHWSPEEDTFLKEVYLNSSKAETLKIINKPWTAICRRAHKLGLYRDKTLINNDRAIRLKPRKDACSEKEKQLLKEIFEHSTKKVILEKFNKFNRSSRSIFRFAKQLGLKRNPKIIKQEMIEAGKNAPLSPDLNPWTEEEDEILKEYYSTSLQHEIEEKLLGKRTFKAIKGRARALDLTREKKYIDIDRAKHLKENFGVDSTWQLNTVRKKSRQTNLEKRGVEYPTQSPQVRDKIRKTVQERYGVDNVSQSEDIKEKIVKTNIEKFGVENPQQNPEIQNKTKETCQEKYGVNNPFQLTGRVQAGMIQKYGVKSPLQVPEIQEKQQATNIERYGVPIPSQNKEIQEKIEKTNLHQFGFKTPLQNEEIKKKIIATNLNRYGVANPAKLEATKEKARQTCLARYGVEYTQQIPEIRNKGYETSKRNKSFEHSKEEELFGQYLKMIDSTTETHKKHPILNHVIDFYMHNLDLWIQYDGTYWHGKTVRKNVTRRSKKIELVKLRDKFQNENIPNLIRFWSDEVQSAIKNNTILDFIKTKIS